jgi:hypothetical protein
LRTRTKYVPRRDNKRVRLFEDSVVGNIDEWHLNNPTALAGQSLDVVACDDEAGGQTTGDREEQCVQNG